MSAAVRPGELSSARRSLIQRGLRPIEARKWTMTAVAVLIPCSALVPFVETRVAIMILVSIVALAHMTWIVTLTTLAVDLFPASRLGSIFGVIAAGSGLGGMLFTNLVGRLVTHFSYAPVFVIMGCLHPLALILIWRAVASARRARTELETATGKKAAGPSVPASASK